MLPKGTFFANTRRIFGILGMNHVSQSAFEVARPGEFCNTVILPKKVKFKATLMQKKTTFQKWLAFYQEVCRLNLWSSEHAYHFDWENVSPVHVCQFYLEEWPKNCIKSLFWKEIFVNTRNRCLMCPVCFSSPAEFLNWWIVNGVKFLSRLLNTSCSDVITVPLFF